MHREHMETAIFAAAKGSAVAVFADTLDRAQRLAHEVEAAVPTELWLQKVSYVNGRHSIEFPGGGSIRFISLRQSARGLSLDRVFVPIGTDQAALEDIVPALCTSQEGVLTGY